MEHAPVEKLSANLRRTFQQSKAVRIDQLQWQDFRQLRGAARVLSIDTDLEFALAIPRNAQGAVPTLRQFNLAKDRACQLLVLNDRQ
ncbi:hypothetical protein D3C72_1647710 [compost metagenome]